MTSTSEKVRALFLTALMVVSVFGATFAFSGAAAAEAANSGLVSVDTSVPDNPIENDSVIEVALNESVDSALTGSDINVWITNRTGTNINVSDDVSVVRGGQGGRLAFTVDGARDIGPTESVKFNITAFPADSSSNHTVTVTSRAVRSGGTLDSTAAPFQGELVAINVTNGTSSVIDIKKDAGSGVTSVKTVGTGPNSTIYVFDTSNANAGETWYFDVRDGSGGSASNTTIEIRDMGLSVSASSTSLTEGDSVTFTANADEVSREVRFQLLDADGNVVQEKFKTLDSQGQAKFKNSSMQPGDYTVEVVDTRSGVSNTTDTVTVSQAAKFDASFPQSVYEDSRGDVIPIEISVTKGQTARVTLGSNSSGYNVTFDVTDGGAASDATEDGTVTVLFNTSDTTSSGATSALYVKGTEDSISGYQDAASGLKTIIASGGYDLSVGSTSGSETDVSQVNVQSRSTDALNTWIAPNAKTTTTRAGIVKHATQASKVSTHDNLIVSIDVSGLEGAGVAGNPMNGTVSGLSLNVTEQNPGQNTQPIELHGNDSSVTIVDDTENDTIYAEIDVSAAGFEKGDEVQVEFIIAGTNTRLASSNNLLSKGEIQSVSNTFTVQEDKASFDNDPVVVNAAANQTITGTTTRAPGTNLTVTAKASGQFLKSSTTVEVQDDKTWSVDFDFSGQSEGTEFTVEVKAPSASADGKISGPSTVTFNDQDSSGTTVTVSSVYLPAGGFVAIHEGSASGPVIGSTNFLTSGTHTDVKVTLEEPYSDPQTVTLVAMPHKDTNGNKTYEFPMADGPYTKGGSAVTDSASVTIDRGTPTPRVVTVQQPSPTPKVVEETRIVEETRVVEQTRTVVQTQVVTVTQGQPGFGIAVAVLALLAAALLAVRRRD